MDKQQRIYFKVRIRSIDIRFGADFQRLFRAERFLFATAVQIRLSCFFRLTSNRIFYRNAINKSTQQINISINFYKWLLHGCEKL